MCSVSSSQSPLPPLGASHKQALLCLLPSQPRLLDNFPGEDKEIMHGHGFGMLKGANRRGKSYRCFRSDMVTEW